MAAFRSHLSSSFMSSRSFTTDARTTAAAKAVAVLVREGNCAAVAENARLRQALRHAREAVLQGDRALALRCLADALNEAQPPPQPPAARGHLCAMCGGRARTVWQVEPVGRWQGLAPPLRQLCRRCHRMQQ